MTRPRQITDHGERFVVKAYRDGTWTIVEYSHERVIADSLARTWRTDPAVSMTHVEDRGEQEPKRDG